MLVRGHAGRAKSGGGPLQNASRARGPSAVAPASWSAPAERSGDGAFARTRRQRTTNNCRPLESGVALRFPPQSKPLRAHAGNRLSRQRLGVRPALWRFSSGLCVSFMPKRLARAKAAEGRRTPGRFARSQGARPTRQHLECGGFSAAAERAKFNADEAPLIVARAWLASHRDRYGSIIAQSSSSSSSSSFSSSDFPVFDYGDEDEDDLVAASAALRYHWAVNAPHSRRCARFAGA
jgi:hypothetical protein